MAIDYSGLFANPADIRARRVDELMKQQQAMSMGGGSMSQLLGQVAGGGNVMGQLLAEGIAQQAGLKTQEEKQAENAQEIFKNIDQNDPQSYYAAAQALNKSGLTKASMTIFERGKALETQNSQEARQVASDRRDKVRFLWESEKNAKTKEESESIRAITMAVKFDPTKPFEYYNNLGKALMEEGHFEAGNTALENARDYISSSDDPKAVAEWKYFSGLSEEKKGEYLALKRASKIINDGKAIYEVQPDGTRVKVADVKLKPGEEPDVIKAQEAAKAEGKIIGTTAAELEANALNSEASVDKQLATLDSLEMHPGYKKAVGWQGNFPTVAGTDASDFESELEQSKAQTFLVEIKNLQGMGALSDKEGETATKAANALSTNISEAQFKKHLATIRKYLLLAKLRSKKAKVEAKKRFTETQTAGQQATQPSTTLEWDTETQSWR